jgi:serine/threonine-protein kinase
MASDRMSAPPRLDEARRRQLEAALQERARLLQPTAAVIERALLRCTPRAGQAAADPALPAPELVPDSSASTATAGAPSTAGGAGVPTAQAVAATVISQAGAPPSAASEAPLTATAFSEATQGTDRFTALAGGRVLAGYRIEEMIGSGAMGQVYRATQLSMNRQVAFKVLAPKLASSPRFRERFLREARAAGRLHHPNLISVHDVAEADGLMFFSMELVEGTSLRALLTKQGRTPEVRALEMMRQVLEALKYAHAAGIIHRDIKPDNIMLTKAGMVKLADLGLSKNEGDDEDAYTTQSGAIMGTPHYMAPEQGRDAHSVDHRADLYAVGATLYHLVCGTPPFTGESAMEVVIKAAAQPLRFPEPGPSPAVRVLISRLMAKKPEDRPQTASEALDIVSKLRRQKMETDPEHQEDAHAAIARARGRRLRRTLRRATWIGFALSIATVIVLFLLVMSGSWSWRSLERRVEDLCANHQFAKAQTAIDLYEGGGNVFGAHAQEITRLRTKVGEAWDSWAFLQAKPAFDAFHGHLAGKRLVEAYAALHKIEDDWLSPGVRRDQDEFQRQWEEAMVKAQAQAERAGDPADTRAREMQDILTHLGAEIWSGVGFQPANTVVLRDNLARFSASGAGSGRWPLPGIRNRRAASLRFSARLIGKDIDPQDHWSIQLAAGRSLAVTGKGLVWRGGESERVLMVGGTGAWLNFALRTDEREVMLQVGEGAEWTPLSTLPSGLSFSWKIGGERVAEVRLKPAPGLKREAASAPAVENGK